RWVQKAIKEPGALTEVAKREGAVTNGISTTWIENKLTQLEKKAADKGKLSPQERKLLRRLTLAKTLKKLAQRKKSRSKS
ncbi:MAG: hypothetical protein C4347_01660, partial [Patescibacteria group bacterium]